MIQGIRIALQSASAIVKSPVMTSWLAMKTPMTHTHPSSYKLALRSCFEDSIMGLL